MAGYPRVTHPSATNFEITRFHSKSVRLACVKHAASVHPEPGSNSHVQVFFLRPVIHLAYCFVWVDSKELKSFQIRSQFVSLKSPDELFDSTLIFGIFRVALLFICQGSCCRCFQRQLCYIITSISLCQQLFKTFFKNFLSSVRRLTLVLRGGI